MLKKIILFGMFVAQVCAATDLRQASRGDLAASLAAYRTYVRSAETAFLPRPLVTADLQLKKVMEALDPRAEVLQANGVFFSFGIVSGEPNIYSVSTDPDVFAGLRRPSMYEKCPTEMFSSIQLSALVDFLNNPDYRDETQYLEKIVPVDRILGAADGLKAENFPLNEVCVQFFLFPVHDIVGITFVKVPSTITSPRSFLEALQFKIFQDSSKRSETIEHHLNNLAMANQLPERIHACETMALLRSHEEDLEKRFLHAQVKIARLEKAKNDAIREALNIQEHLLNLRKRISLRTDGAAAAAAGGGEAG